MIASNKKKGLVYYNDSTDSSDNYEHVFDNNEDVYQENLGCVGNDSMESCIVCSSGNVDCNVDNE